MIQSEIIIDCDAASVTRTIQAACDLRLMVVWRHRLEVCDVTCLGCCVNEEMEEALDHE